MTLLQDATAPPAGAVQLDSVLDMILAGGPLMVPIALCSVVSLAFVVERSVRLRAGELGTARLGREVVERLASAGPEEALELCESREKPLTRILGAGLRRWSMPLLEMEKAVEDAGARELKRLSAPLRPLVVVGMIAPLLGLLGTVFGMIEAFRSIALEQGIGRPEVLASGIAQALITTAAGLSVAIPTQAAYYWLRARIERFANRVEDAYVDLERQREPAAQVGSAA